MISLENISLSYQGQKILNDIHLKVKKGDFLIILGSNGSGKSSLLKLLDGRYSLQKGEALLDDESLSRISAKYLAKHVVTLTQNPLDALFPKLTVQENFKLAALRGNNKQAAENYLARFNAKLPSHLNTLVEKLSGGEQQALALALSFLAEPKVLLLDEHTSALDPHTADQLMQITADEVQKRGITCLLTTHNLALAQKYGSRLIALKQGKIIQDFDAGNKEKLSLEDLKVFCY